LAPRHVWGIVRSCALGRRGNVQMVFFTLLLITGISLTPYLQLGLDQSIALPQDSYLIPYFVDQATLLKVGAPVYFVIQVRPWLPSLLQEFF
jgi:hypothetical protein